METTEPPESTSGAAGPVPDDSTGSTGPDEPEVAPEEPGERPDADADAPEDPESGELTDIEGPAPDALEIDDAEIDDAEIDDAEIEAPEPEAVAPPVVAIVITSGSGPGLEATLASLAGQDYPALSVLVLDNASEADPTARIAAELPTAYVRRLPAKVGFAAAANEALHTVEGATFLLFCHDDVAMDPDAVRVMVEEAYRSNAGIVGPKLVSYDSPEVLLEVGMTVDHYAVPFSAIEPGEIDQEQHDGVRDVFFVSHAALLVRADLFRELGGFDEATSPGCDDIDLCWRARLVGARVLVAPASRMRHRQIAGDEERNASRKSPSDARAATRARVRVLFKSYTTATLLWVLPSGFVLTVLEGLGLALTRRARHGVAVVAGWFPGRGGVRDLRQARAATQQMRQVEDSDIRDLMVRGSARFRSLVVQRLHAGDRLADASSRARARMAVTRQQLRRAPAILALIVGFLIVVGSRALVFQRVPDIGTFQSWPGLGALWSTFGSPWRYTMVGARAPATPAFAMMAALSTGLLGHEGLARTIVVAGALPLGVFGTYRLVRSITGALFPAVAGVIAYAANPVGRDAIGRGDLGPLVFFALAPFVLHALVQASSDRLEGDVDGTTAERRRARAPNDRAADGGVDRRGAVRVVLVVGLLGAVAGSVWPPALLLPVLIAAAFVIAFPLVGGGSAILRAAALALVGAAVSALLVVPWSLSLIGADAATLGLRVRAPLSFGDVLRFDVGPARAGWFTLGLVITAVVPLVIASGPRLVWATRAWVLTLASFALAWLPSRISAGAPVAAPEGVLVPAALGVALAAGLGVSALLDDMRRSRFGWRQVSAVAAAVGLALPLLALAADSVSGRWGLPSSDWPTSVSWMGDLPSSGGFRVLWLGDPSVLPVDAKVVDGIGFGLTRDGSVDARSLWAAPEHAADDVLARAILAARAGDTERLGHLLAPIGVRYVVVVGRLAPGHGPVVPPDPMLADALTRQLDLSVSRIDNGGVVYANDAALPRRAVVPADAPVSSDSGASLADAARSDLAPVARGVDGRQGRSDPAGPGTLLWAEAANGGWHARAAGRDLARTSAFDWTNAFGLPERASVGLRYHGGLVPGLLRALELVLWIVAIVVWRRTRTRRTRRVRGEPA